jgi:hypothetical protein
MKKFLLECFCNIFIPAIILVDTVTVFAQSNIAVSNDELVPLNVSSQADSKSEVETVQLHDNSAQLRNNSDLSKSSYVAAGETKNNLGKLADNVGESKSDSTITDEIGLGTELRKILARKPEIPLDKIPTRNRTEVAADPHSNYRNNNSKLADNTPPTVIRAQSNEDPLATRPEPPQGLVSDLSVIPPALLNDPKTTNSNSNINTPPVTYPNHTNTHHTQNHSDEQSKNVIRNPPPIDKPLIVNNDLATVVNGWLLVATIISVAALVYVAIIAVDYHQRWMQMLTAQNDRYFVPEDSAYNGLTDIYDSPEKSRLGTDFFTYPAV